MHKSAFAIVESLRYTAVFSLLVAKVSRQCHQQLNQEVAIIDFVVDFV
jgi:hypothetical protein